jgi:hypothetical protein
MAEILRKSLIGGVSGLLVAALCRSCARDAVQIFRVTKNISRRVALLLQNSPIDPDTT